MWLILLSPECRWFRIRRTYQALGDEQSAEQWHMQLDDLLEDHADLAMMNTLVQAQHKELGKTLEPDDSRWAE